MSLLDSKRNRVPFERWLPPLVACAVPVALILLLWHLVPGSFQKNENEDYFCFYLPVAQNIAHGQGITLNGKIAIEYPPGYPVLIAAVLVAARIVHLDAEALLRVSIAFYLALSALLIYAIARVLWNRRSALVVSLIWSFYPLVEWAGKQQNSELPFMPFLYGAFLLLLLGWRSSKNRNLYFFFGGLACGMAMLIRPIAIGFGLLAAFLVLMGRRYPMREKIVVVALIILGNAFAVGPWEAWMYHETGGVHLLCHGRDAVSMYDGMVFAIFNPEKFRKGVPVPRDVRDFMERTIPKTYAARSTKQMAGLVIAELRTHPITMAKLFLIKAARSWYGTNSNRLESVILAVQLLYIVLIALSCWMFFTSRPDYRFPLAMGLLLLVYFWAMTISVLSIVRYMVPVVALMFIYFPALKPLVEFPRRLLFDGKLEDGG